MATVSKWTPFGVALDLTATGSTVTRISATQYTVKINASWEAYYNGAQTNYGMKASSGGGSATLNKFGTNASSGSGSFTGTYSISGNGSATKTITVTFTNYEEDWQGNVTESATKDVTFDITVPAWTSYTVSYNANGGSGAPANQTKWKDQTLTLSSTVPTRTGYTFIGWALSKSNADNGTWYYKAGSSCGKNENLTLYAVWDANSYTYNIVYKSSSGVQLGTGTITYDFGTTNNVSPKSYTGYTSPNSQSVKWDSTSAKTITFTYTPISYNVTINCNGGSGVSSTIYTIETATFNLGTPSRTGYAFSGWTGSNGSTAQKTVSISKGSTGNKSYTAQWAEYKLTVNYYSNKANYGTLNGTTLNVSTGTNVLVHSEEYLYDNEYSDGLDNIQNTGHLYLSRVGYKPTGYWGTSVDGGILVNQNTKFETGRALAVALGKNIANGNASVNVYPQWKPSGIVYIDNGTTLDAYLPYIDNGTSWELYLAYVDNGASWDVVS